MNKKLFYVAAALIVIFSAAAVVINVSAAQPVPNAAGNVDAVQCDTSTRVPGDINGDKRVTNADLTRLMKYLAGESVQVNKDALDVNGDGRVNNRDLLRLMKHLADPDVEIYGG